MRSICLALVVMWMAAAEAGAGERSAITQQVVALTADDGHRIPGILMYPAVGPDPHSPGIVLLHGGPFGHPIRTQSAARFVAERLAARGYTTLSILSRHATGYYSIPVEAGSADLKAAVDWLAGLGIRDVILAGHSFGSVRVALYAADSRDSRVKALVHYAPTNSPSDYLPRAFGAQRYADEVARLQRLVADGRGDEPTLIEIPFPPPAPAGAKFAYIMTARNWLSWWGPNSLAQNLRLMGRLRLPMLMITGAEDMFVTREYQQRLAAAASASPRVDTMIYAGTGHELAGAEERAATDTERWLTTLGLGVRPRVTTRLVDVAVGEGGTQALSMQAGVLFEPGAGLQDDAPAVMLLYDSGQDVLTNPSEWLAPWLAQRGYRVLVPQDSSYGPNVDRIGEHGTDADLAAWVGWLSGDGRRSVVIAGRGWGGERAARFLQRHPQKSVRGLAFLATPPDGARWARAQIGDAAYEAAVARATGAIANGSGGATLIAARGVQPGDGAGRAPYRVHMLADAFLARFGPLRIPLERVLPDLPQAVFLAVDDADGRATPVEVAALAAAAGSRATLYRGVPDSAPDRPDAALADALLRWLRSVTAGDGR